VGHGELTILVLGLCALSAGCAFITGRMIGARTVLLASRRNHREVRALLDITEAVSGTLDLHEVMSLVVRRVGERVGAQRCSIVFVDQVAQRCFVMAASDNPEADMLAIDLAKYPEIKHAIDTAEPVWVEDVATDPLLEPVRELLLQQGYRSLLVLPLVYGKEVLGTLFLRASRELPFTESEMRFCRIAAASSANALKNALLYRDVAREAARHRSTGEKLRRVLDGTPDVIIATDADGCITEFNLAAEALTACFAREAAGRPLAEILPEAVSQVEFGRKGRELVLTRPDGAPCEIHFVSAPLTGLSGEITGGCTSVVTSPTCAARRRAWRRPSACPAWARSLRGSRTS
jgi:PAS domain-containing protein